MEESLLKFDNQLKERLSTVENIVIRLDKQYSEIREEVKAVTFKADQNAETISHFENIHSPREIISTAGKTGHDARGKRKQS